MFPVELDHFVGVQKIKAFQLFIFITLPRFKISLKRVQYYN